VSRFQGVQALTNNDLFPTLFSVKPTVFCVGRIMKRKLIFSIITFVIIFVFLELTARLLETSLLSTAKATCHESGWQEKFFASLFDWHEPDQDLLWRFKAGLNNPLIKTNSDHLIGDEIKGRKGERIFRILLLGDSSPVGIGLKSYMLTFPEILKYLLGIECESLRKVEVINAAVSGYSSEQITRFLELKGWSYKPDLVILYCGNNDASISGPYTDQELLESQRLKAVRNYLSHLAIYRLLRGILVKQISSSSDRFLKIRVGLNRFGENLRSIADSCSKHNCWLIILKPPAPYLWPAGLQFKVFTHITGENGQALIPNAMTKLLGREIKYCLSDDLFNRLYGWGDKFTRTVYQSAYMDSLSPIQSIEYYTQLLKQDTNNPVLLNNLGVSFWENRQYLMADECLRKARKIFVKQQSAEPNPVVTAAGSPFLYNIGINCLFLNGANMSALEDTNSVVFKYLDSALQADYFSLRIKRSYWKKIDELKDLPNVVVIDLPHIFRMNGGDNLFIDHCHPTAEGHLLIAHELCRAVCRAFSKVP